MAPNTISLTEATAIPPSVTITPEGGQPVTFEKNKNGDWRNAKDFSQELEYVSVDKNGKITVRSANHDTVLGPDGSFKEKNWKSGKTEQEIDADGTAHRYDHNNGTETVIKPASHVAEDESIDGWEVKGYVVPDDQEHATTIEKNSDGTVTVKRGDRNEQYAGVESDGKGGIKLTGRMESDGKGGFKPADKTSVEISEDGTTIRRDKNGKVS